MKEKIKLILKSLRQYKRYAIITPFFMVGEAAMECFLPFLMSIFIDIVGKIKNPEDFFTWFPTEKLGGTLYMSVFVVIVLLVVMSMLSMMFGILGGKTAAKASVGMASNLREDLYKKIQSFSFANIDKFSTSSLVTRMTTDVNNVQMAFQMCIRIVIRAPLMLIFSAVMAFVTGGWLASVFIILIPLLGLGFYLIAKSAIKIFKRVFKRYDKLNESVQENVSGIRVVKSYVREDYEKQKFNEASNNLSGDFIKVEKIIALNNPMMNTSIHLSNILIIGIGSYFVNAMVISVIGSEITYGAISVGTLSALLTYGIQVLTSLLMISMILAMLIMSLESIRRIGEVLQEEAQIKNPEVPLYDIKNGDIEFKNVNFKYSLNAQKNTLENINLKIKSGQFVGIMGSTGSGKTSLVNLISRLYDVYEGEVIVGDKNVKEYDLKSLRDAVSVVLQKNVLFSGTITSNLRWGNPNATEEDMWKALDIAQASEIVKGKEEGLLCPVEQGGSNFSGGQKQRLCIARAILKKPKILILDDSTSAVDTKTDRLIRKGLKEDLKGMTKIVIAQRISSIEDADQIIILDNGKIDQIGTHDELIKTNKIYQEVYATQNKVGGNK